VLAIHRQTLGQAGRRPAALLVGLCLWSLLSAACASPAESTLPLQNETDLPLRVSIVDANPRARSERRRRYVELPPGQSLRLDLAFSRDGSGRAVRFEARTPDGAHFYGRDLGAEEAGALQRASAVVRFGPAELNLIPRSSAAALQPILPNLAARRPAIADEVDPGAPPRGAVDDDPNTFWRGLNVPPQVTASWAVDLGEPATIDRVQLDVECVNCGPVRIRLTFLNQPLPAIEFARPGYQQTSSILDSVDRLSDAVVGQIDLTGYARSRDTLAAAPSQPLPGVRTVIATIVDAPENVGLYDVRIGGQRPTD
jgi:hypothetical protein